MTRLGPISESPSGINAYSCSRTVMGYIRDGMVIFSIQGLSPYGLNINTNDRAHKWRTRIRPIWTTRLEPSGHWRAQCDASERASTQLDAITRLLLVVDQVAAVTFKPELHESNISCAWRWKCHGTHLAYAHDGNWGRTLRTVLVTPSCKFWRSRRSQFARKLTKKTSERWTSEHLT